MHSLEIFSNVNTKLFSTSLSIREREWERELGMISVICGLVSNVIWGPVKWEVVGE